MIILSKFAETLYSLMREKNINAPALGKILETDRTNITRYLRAERLPLYHGFIALCEYFNVSADVLLGRVDYSNEELFQPIQPFSSTLRRIMKETGTSQYSIVKKLGVSGGTMYYWLSGKSLPTVENLDKLADFMDVSIDYLLGRIA